MQAEIALSTFFGVFVGVVLTVFGGRFYVQRLVDRRLGEVANSTAPVPISSRKRMVWRTAVVATVAILLAIMLLPTQAFAQAAGWMRCLGRNRDICYSNGNVGIGQFAPALQNGGSNRLVDINGSLNPGLALTNIGSNGRQFLLYSRAASGLKFSIFDATAGKDRLGIDENGNVGIGTANPRAPLHIVSEPGNGLILDSNAATSPYLALRGSIGGVIADMNLVTQINGSHDYRLDITDREGQPKVSVLNNGNVGIGTTNPQSALQIEGYAQLDITNGIPPTQDCINDLHRGRMKVDSLTELLYVCTETGWKTFGHGLQNYEIVTGPVLYRGGWTHEVLCPPGKIVIGGGGGGSVINGTRYPDILAASYPNSTGSGWIIEAYQINTVDGAKGLHVYAICVTN